LYTTIAADERERATDGLLEQMGILVGVAQNADDCGVRTSHLLCHVTIEILRRHDADRF